jgi:hypothetical protein
MILNIFINQSHCFRRRDAKGAEKFVNKNNQILCVLCDFAVSMFFK